MFFYHGAHLMDEGFTCKTSKITSRIDHEEGPAEHEHQQRHGSFVHFRHTLQGDAQIAGHEYDDDSNS